VGQGGAHQAGGAKDVDVQNVVPFLVRDVLDSSGGADAGVGDNDVKAAQPLGDFGYGLAY
jgi:hypothetical protein